MKPLRTWPSDTPTRSPFALPGGLAGRLAGRLMLHTNRQRELLELMDVREGEQVLEVGYGPGGLIRLLARTAAGRVCGVDPSRDMRDMAAGVNRHEVAGGRVDLRLGTAERTGFGAAEFDCVVSVNNVAIWPDLEAGLRELHRVTRPGGRAVVAWHGGTRPSRPARALALPEPALARVERGLNERFSGVERRELAALTVFRAVR